jgi:hypothetical protein
MSKPDPTAAGAPGAWRQRLSTAGARLLLVWAGLGLGVAFLATPVKFLAPTLTLPVALDVGRQTFAAYNAVDLAVLAVMVVMGALSGRPRAWLFALCAPAAVILLQTFWLLPALDVRTLAVIAGEEVPPSRLHHLYVAAEALKIVWLLAAGLGGALSRPAGTSAAPRAGAPDPLSYRSVSP